MLHQRPLDAELGAESVMSVLMRPSEIELVP